MLQVPTACRILRQSALTASRLCSLSLAGCSDLGDLEVALTVQCLTQLTLLDVRGLNRMRSAALTAIGSLAKLHTLDLSMCDAAVNDHSVVPLSQSLALSKTIRKVRATIR